MITEDILFNYCTDCIMNQISAETWQFLVSIFLSILPFILSFSRKKPAFAKNIMLLWSILYILFEITNPLYLSLIRGSSHAIYISLFRVASIINLTGYIIVNWQFKNIVIEVFRDINKKSIKELNYLNSIKSLDEKKIQTILNNFSKDAVHLYSFSGTANFLNRNHRSFDEDQFKRIKKLGYNCKILVSKYSPYLDELCQDNVQIRLYPPNDTGSIFRGNIKNNQKACIFNKCLINNDINYNYIEIDNTDVANVFINHFYSMFKTQKKNSIKHIIFDLAGVVFDGDIELFFKAVSDITEHTVKNQATYHGCVNTDLNLGKIDICGFLKEAFAIELDEEQKIKVIEAWNSTWTLNPYMKQYIEELKQLGYQISIASNCDDENTNKYELNGWLNIFDYKFLSNIIKKVKPNPEFYMEIISVLKCHPSECLFIDDYKPNLDAAQKQNFKTLFITRTYDPLKKISTIREHINDY